MKNSLVFIVLVMISMLAFGCNETNPVASDAIAMGNETKAVSEIDEVVAKEAYHPQLDGTVEVIVNTNFPDASAYRATGVVKETKVIIGSITITAHRNISLTEFVFADFASAMMGRNFQNMYLQLKKVPLTSTKGNLNYNTVGFYDFIPFYPVKMAAEQKIEVFVYADIKTGAEDLKKIIRGLVFYSISGIDDKTGKPFKYQRPRELQKIYIVPNGTLNVSSLGMPPQKLVMGTTNQNVYTYLLQAEYEDIIITQQTISCTVSGRVSLQNIRLMSPNGYSEGPAQFCNSPDVKSTNVKFGRGEIQINKGETWIINVAADPTPANAGGVSGTAHVFGIVMEDNDPSQESIVAKGAKSGVILSRANHSLIFHRKDLNLPDSDQWGSEIKVFRTALKVEWASDTPRGFSVGSSSQTIGKIIVTNESNAGGYSATVKALQISIESNLPPVGNRMMDVYVDNLSGDSLGGFIWFDGEKLADANYPDAGFTDVEIKPGESREFIIVLDTKNGNNAGDFLLSINILQGGIVWTDAAGFDIHEVDSLPLISKTMTY